MVIHCSCLENNDIVCGIHACGSRVDLTQQTHHATIEFSYPMFLSGLGVLTSYLFARALIGLGLATVEKKHEVDGMRFYTRVLPVGIAHAGKYPPTTNINN